MKKAFILAAAAALLIGGCTVTGISGSSDILGGSDSESSGTENSAVSPSDITTIKWGVEAFPYEEKVCMAELNERLSAEGSNIRVELVELDMGMDIDMTFAKLITDYEKENGSFDIVTYGSDWQDKIGAANILIESGYFLELNADDKARFTDIPEICWNAAKVKGKNYTVPALNFGLSRDAGLFFSFNTKYIPEDEIKNFSGTLAEIEDILNSVSPDKKLTGLQFGINYLDFAFYTPASAKGGLYLSDKTMTAVNPYEDEKVIEHARRLNSLYKKGYINYNIDFSGFGSNESINTDFAVAVSRARISEEDLNERLGKDHRVIVYSQPYYMENRLLHSTGIPVGSAHPDEAMELLKRLHSDKEFSGLLSENERNAIGLPCDNEPVDAGEMKLSPFAGFELKYTDIGDFKEVSDLCQNSFDKLCKADDFDKTLAEINAELQDAGIDEYVARVNQRLEESNAASNQ